MSNLADDLKQARERCGLTINDLVVRTRIGRTSLEALERGDYAQLPGEVFIVGFIRSYAKEVGIDDNEAVRRYKEETERQAGPQQAAPEDGVKVAPPEDERPGKGEPKGVPVGYIAALAVLLALAAALAYFVTVKEEPVLKAKAPATAARPPAAPPAKTVPVAKAVPETVQEPFAGATTVVEPPSEEPVSPEAEVPAVILDIKVVSPTWVAYEADEKPYRILGVLKAGRNFHIEADEYILLDTGNAGGLELVFNGKPLGAMGPSGAVRKNILYSADAQGVAGRPRVPRPVITDAEVSGTEAVVPSVEDTVLEPHTLPEREGGRTGTDPVR